MVAAVAVGVPLAFDPGGYFIFLPIKWTLATVLVAAGLASLIIERRPVPRSAVVAAWAALLLVFVLSSLVGTGGLTSWIGYPGRYLGVIAWATFFGAFVLGASLTRERDRARVVVAASATSILVSAYALVQKVGIDPIEWSENIDVSRTRSTLGNAAFLGAYLAMIVPLTGRLALSASEPARVRVLHAAATVAGVIALLTTETRGAWLGALAGLVVVLALEHRRLRAAPRRFAVALGAALVLVVVLVTVSPYGSRVRSITNPEAATGHGRLTQWGRTLDMIADRPALGWGPDTYAFTFPRFIDATFERTVGRQAIPDRAHNVFLDLAAWTGGLGVAAYLGVIGLMAWAVARGRERDALTVGLAGACTAYLGQLQFSFPIADLDTVFWLFAGLLVAAGGPRATVVSRLWAVVPVVVALTVAAWGGTELTADRMLRRSLELEAKGEFSEAQRVVDRSADLAIGRAQYLEAAARLHRRVGEASGRAADFERGLEVLADAHRLVPRDLELVMDQADLLLSWGEAALDRHLIERAAAGYERILRRDPFSSRAHLKLGVAYVQLDRSDEAEAEWRSAASLAPRSPGPLVNLGRLYEQQGRTADARSALRAALALDPGNASARDLLRRLGDEAVP